MRFRNDDSPKRELTDTVSEEHPMRMAAVAEERIKAMHHHSDGSSVEIREIGSREFIQQSMSSSLEGKLGGDFSIGGDEEKHPRQDIVKIEYERKSQNSQPQQLYGTQQAVTGGASHHQETVMMGCNCGLEWTVTGQSAKQTDSGGIKIEQYGNTATGGAVYAKGAGGEGIKYGSSGGQQQKSYKG